MKKRMNNNKRKHREASRVVCHMPPEYIRHWGKSVQQCERFLVVFCQDT